VTPVEGGTLQEAKEEEHADDLANLLEDLGHR
jgi:hypothetical protein